MKSTPANLTLIQVFQREKLSKMKNTTTEKPMQPNTRSNHYLMANGHRLDINSEGQFHCFLCNAVGYAEEIGTCSAPDSEREEWDSRYSPAEAGDLPRYRKGTLEAKLDSLLPNYESFDVIAHELWSDGDGGWSVNDSWKMARGVSREDAISALRNRWEVFKVNYHAKARVCDLTDANWSGDEFPALLEVDCIAFAEIRNAAFN